ncbi:MAG TPA: MBL fold metallo-hydrolase, partial [Gaiellaceae bacterium]|nr:MBL fold metallo-hydrolase [Gaiellaceae bacterium]
ALIDPLVPPEDAERFHRALDRDAARAERVHVLLTVHYHSRSAAELAERHQADLVTASSRGLPPGIEAFPTARSNEVVYWLPERRTLVVGDVILGGPRLCPESWLPAGVGHAELRASLRPLLELDVERILVSHGEPVLAGGAGALAALL